MTGRVTELARALVQRFGIRPDREDEVAALLEDFAVAEIVDALGDDDYLREIYGEENLVERCRELEAKLETAEAAPNIPGNIPSAAAALGRLGGLKRAASMTPEQRMAIARIGGAAAAAATAARKAAPA